MRNGRLRHRCVIEAQVQGRADDGAVAVTWQAFGDPLYAEIKPMSVNGLMAAQAAQSRAAVMIVIRRRTGIDATMRVRRLADDAIFPLAADPLPDAESGREYLTLACAQGVSDGR